MTKSEGKPKETEQYFDCMAWLERVQAEIYEEIKDMTCEEELEYWRKAAERGPHRKQWQEAYRRAGIVRESPPGRGDRSKQSSECGEGKGTIRGSGTAS